MDRGSDHPPNQPVGDLGRQISADPRVLPLPSPPADEIVALIEPLQEKRNVARIVLEIRIHGYDHVAARLLKSGLHGCGLAKVAPQLHDPDRRKPVPETLESGNRLVAAAIIHKDPF